MRRSLYLLILLFSIGCSPLAKKQDHPQTNQKLTSEQLEAPLELKKLNLFAQLESKNRRLKQVGSSFQLRFWRQDLGTQNEGPFVDPGLKVCTRPWMKMENGYQHGSYDTTPVSIEFSDLDGIFTIEPIFFSMPGDWELHIELCENHVECKDEGYGGCPEGTVVDRAIKFIEIHE